MMRRVFKTVLWAALFPWVWAAGMIPAGLMGLFLDYGASWFIGWGVAIGVLAAFGTAGIVHEKLNEGLRAKEPADRADP